MATPSLWVAAHSYVVDDLVTHEAVIYKCLANHTSSTGNEPDAVDDTTWQTYWAVQSATWGDWLYGRVPAWLRSLDAAGGYPLYRYLRLFGRSENQSQQDINDFPSLRDIDLCKSAFLDGLAYTLGMLLPHAVDEVTQRRLLAAIVMLYRQKGTLKSLQFLVQRYLGRTVTITVEEWQIHLYKAVYDDTGLSSGDKPIIRAEINRLLSLYEPAGLIHHIKGSSDPDEVGTLNLEGDLNVSFTLNVVF